MPKQEASGDAGQNDIMATAELKSILAQAKKNRPANCAIALTKDKEGVILLDKRKKPKALAIELKKSAAGLGLVLDTNTLRFGRVSVDVEEDASLLSLSVNKDAPGAMRPKLLEHLKKAGFSKLEIVVDEGLDTEADTDEQPVSAATDPNASPPRDPAPGSEGAALPDAAALTRNLGDLARRIPPFIAQAPDRKKEVVDLASRAQASLKSGDIKGASGLIDQLRAALSDAANGGPVASLAVDPAVAMKLRKAVDVWEATLGKIDRDLDQLSKTVVAASKDHALGKDFKQDFEKVVEPLMQNLDRTLSSLLKKAASADTQAGHAALLDEARRVIATYRKLFQSNPVIAHVDTNPFVPLSIGKTLMGSLAAVSSTFA